MALIKKSRIPSIPYLEQKIEEIVAIVNPSQEEIRLLTRYKELRELRLAMERPSQNEAYSGQNWCH